MTKLDLIDSPVMSKSIGELIRTRRRFLGLTAADLADRAGLSKTIVSFIENDSGSYSSDSIDRICKVLGCSLSDLEKPLPDIADTIVASFRSPIEQARLRTKMTAKQAADALGIEYSTYLQYEQGVRSPSPKALVKIAEFYKADPSIFEKESNQSLFEICKALASSLNEKVQAIEALKLSPQALVALSQLSEESRKKAELQIITLFIEEANKIN